MGDVFKALADESRRTLLDQLFVRDGQSLVQLSAHLPAMTRFGVARHVGVLEAAGLVTAVKVGREKRHYLNPVPIRLLHDRWIAKYQEPAVGILAALKTTLEEPMSETQPTTVDEGPGHVWVVHVRATPSQVWDAITDPATVGHWCHGVTYVEARWEAGAEFDEVLGDRLVARIRIEEVVPPGRLVMWIDSQVHEGVSGEPPYRQTWAIEDAGGGVTRATVRSDHLVAGGATEQLLQGGMRALLDSLKSLLETGQALAITGG